MRILYIITQAECGGAQKNVLDSAIKMKNLGHKVLLCVGKQEKNNDKWLLEQFKKNGFIDEEIYILQNLKREINYLKDLKVIFDTYYLVKKINPHIVHLHSTKAGIICSIAAKLVKVKVIYTAHGFVFSEKISLFKKYFYIFAEFIASFFRDLTITVSDYDKKIAEKFKVIRKNKGVVIYNGVNESKKYNIFNKEVAKNKILDKIGIKNKNIKIVGVVANLYKNKGINYLIDAAKNIYESYDRNIIFVIIGDGEEKNNLYRQIIKNSLNNNVFLIGSINDAYRYLKAFDLIVLPSTKEGLPYILIESILINIPFVATNVGGIPEIVKYNKIDLIPSCDSQALFQAIKHFFCTKKDYQLHLPKQFTLNYMIDKLNKEYQKITQINNRPLRKKSFLITIPAYNEALIIENSILSINEYLKKKYQNLLKSGLIKICVAINGSTDSTEEIVKKNQNIIPYLYYTITHQKGRGKALDNTWSNATEDVFLYIDSDLAYALEDLGGMIDSYLNNENYDLVVASRRIKDSIVKRHPIRIILTGGYNRLVKLLFFNNFTDAQAGCKSVKKYAYQRIRKNIYTYEGWFFDTALLIYSEKNGYKIKDLAITCIDNRKWRLAIINTIAYFFKNLIILRLKTLFKGYRN